MSSDGDLPDHLSEAALGKRLDELLASLSPTPTPTAEQMVGKFRVDRLVGFGAFGVVYSASDTDLDRQVALKLPRIEVLADRERRRRFKDEAHLAATLDHPNIVPAYEAVLDGPAPYIASMFVDGPNLAEFISQNPSGIDWKHAAEHIAQLADGVAYAHSRGVFHRDLKPSNVLLQPISELPDALPDFRPRLTDFGLAKAVGIDQLDTRTSMMIGTPLYMAPEQFDSDINPENGMNMAAVDIYSLGVMLFELLSGTPPRADHSYRQLLDLRGSVISMQPLMASTNVPADLRKICRTCLEVNPVARYQSAEELAEVLRSCIAGGSCKHRSIGWRGQLDYWSQQPQRIRDAGKFLLWSHVLMAVWVTSVSVLAPLIYGEVPSFYLRGLGELAIVLVTMHCPMIWLAIQTSRGKRWAVPVGLLATGLAGLPVYLPIFTEATFFADLYDSAPPFFKFMVHMMLSLCFLTSFGLYLAAYRAWRRLRIA